MVTSLTARWSRWAATFSTLKSYYALCSVGRKEGRKVGQGGAIIGLVPKTHINYIKRSCTANYQLLVGSHYGVARQAIRVFYAHHAYKTCFCFGVCQIAGLLLNWSKICD